MNKPFSLPRLYPILDAGILLACDIRLQDFARTLQSAGIRFLQYRDKEGSDEVVLDRARILRNIFPMGEATLILNDRAHLCEAAAFDGVHVGQDDLSPKLAREAIGPERLLGVSTHNPRQVAAADREPVDYIAIGPVFGTQSKPDPDPVIGREGVASARRSTSRPLVAIGGLTLENSRLILRAGADSIAIISALLPHPRRPLPGTAKLLEDFLARIG